MKDTLRADKEVEGTMYRVGGFCAEGVWAILSASKLQIFIS